MHTNRYFMFFGQLILLTFLLAGCRSIENAPEATIVWQDDFDDGTVDGWFGHEFHYSEYFVEDGALAFGLGDGFIGHDSDVLHGTWSFDVYLSGDPGRTNAIRFTEGFTNDQNMLIENTLNTEVILFNQFDDAEPLEKRIDLGEVVTGWHHFDITKGTDDVIRVYVDGDFLLELFDDRPFLTDKIFLFSSFEGPAFDNVVVSDAVLYSD
ncbi:MAG: hypothetical protein PVF85_02710 [Anaerolineales bacterium]